MWPAVVAPTRGDRLRRTLAEVPLPRAADGRLVRAIDVTGWLRAHAHTSLQRILCHTYGRGKHKHVPVPGRPYSIACALGPGRSSWPAPLDALRLTSGDDAATATATDTRLYDTATARPWDRLMTVPRVGPTVRSTLTGIPSDWM